MTEVIPSPSTGIQLLAELESNGAITPTALKLPPETTLDQCVALAGMFGQLHRTSAWLIGDLMLHTEKVHGETYPQVAEATGLSPGTLHNYTSVCSRIPRSRRRAAVPFSTHAEVAYLEPEDQDKWLKEAQDNKWTKAELRDARNKEDGNPPPAVEVVCTCPTCGNTHMHPVEDATT